MNTLFFTVQDACCQAVHPFYQTLSHLVKEALTVVPNEPEALVHFRGLIALWIIRYRGLLLKRHAVWHASESLGACDSLKCVWYTDEIRCLNTILQAVKDGWLPLPVHKIPKKGEVFVPGVSLTLERLVHDRDCPTSLRWEKLCTQSRSADDGLCYGKTCCYAECRQASEKLKK